MSAQTPPPTPPHRSEAAPAAELERLQQELAQAKDQYVRTLAEFDNTKKRLQREKEEFVKFAAESMVRGLLPILDSLDQALVAVAPKRDFAPQAAGTDAGMSVELRRQRDADAIITGVQLIHRQLLGLLKKEGVSRIPTVGEPFDPHRHEAVGHVEPTNGQADGAIAEEVHAGYLMHGKVLRPAMVKIAKRADSAQQTEDSEPT